MSSLKTYYQNHPNQVPSANYLSFFDRFTNKNIGFGLAGYPNLSEAQLIAQQIGQSNWNGYLGNGQLQDDTHHTYDYYQVYDIASEGYFQNLLNYMQTHFYESVEYNPTQQLNHPYNIFTNNCVTTVQGVMNAAGIPITLVPVANPLGSGYSPIYSPGSLYNALGDRHSGFYTVGSSTEY